VDVCSVVEANGGSPKPGLCPAAGASANADFVILPSPGSSGRPILVGENGPSGPICYGGPCPSSSSQPGGGGQYTLQNPQILPALTVPVGSTVNVTCADGTSPTGSKGVGIGGEGVQYSGTSTAANGVNPFTIPLNTASVTGTVVGSQNVQFYCDNPPVPSQRQINVVAAAANPGSSSPATSCGQVQAAGRRQPECNANGVTQPPTTQTSPSPCPLGAICSDVTSSGTLTLTSLVGTYAGGGQTLTIAAGSPPLASYGPAGGMISTDTNPYDVALQGTTVTLTQVNGKSECYGTLTITYTASSDGNSLTPQSLSCGPPTSQSQNPGLPALTKQ
jgi:hypothetical protein